MKTPPISAAALVSAAFLAAAPLARADAKDEQPQTVDAAARTERAAALGSFLSLAQPAALNGSRAVASAAGGYDGARGTALFEAATEVQLWGPLSVRAGAVYTNSTRTLRPSAGLRVQALSESRHGVDASAGLFYRPEGLSEPEGEIELVTSFGAHAGRTYLLGNLVYGQDPEARERDGEVRLAALYPLKSRLLVGLDSRLRFDLGSDRAKLTAKGEPTVDVLAGPLATVFVDRVALFTQAGFAALRQASALSTGAFVQAGLATSF